MVVRYCSAQKIICWFLAQGDALNQACSTFYSMRTASAKFCPHAGNVEFNTQKEE
jgi:hypothetical protein